jgi:hypothetical protein
MFKDQHLEADFQALPPEKQAEVADFIQFLRQKQAQQISPDQSERLKKAAQLLLGTDAPPTSAEENFLWDRVTQAPVEPIQLNVPDLDE